jgi:hypothetical protein
MSMDRLLICRVGNQWVVNGKGLEGISKARPCFVCVCLCDRRHRDVLFFDRFPSNEQTVKKSRWWLGTDSDRAEL